jgi:hypothetical protein
MVAGLFCDGVLKVEHGLVKITRFLDVFDFQRQMNDATHLNILQRSGYPIGTLAPNQLHVGRIHCLCKMQFFSPLMRLAHEF